jgi:hypothetical protein
MRERGASSAGPPPLPTTGSRLDHSLLMIELSRSSDLMGRPGGKKTKTQRRYYCIGQPGEEGVKTITCRLRLDYL